jgi:hypothetical protein
LGDKFLLDVIVPENSGRFEEPADFTHLLFGLEGGIDPFDQIEKRPQPFYLHTEVVNGILVIKIECPGEERLYDPLALGIDFKKAVKIHIILCPCPAAFIKGRCRLLPI